jgi:steroid 5-alpha reductase family enzyme
MKYLSPLFPFIAGWILLLFTNALSSIGIVNGVAQLTLFAFVVNLPTWRTGRMSYVDIGWPLGLAVIGVVTLVLSEGYWPRTALVSGVYLFVGLRMGIGALHMWKRGKLKVEFPRYEYQRLRWQRAGKTNVPLAMQVEALVQGLANASYLAFPALIIGSNPNPSISIFEIIGLVVWASAFAMESVADAQKLKFLRQMKKAGKGNQVCNVGLWRYSRHPNYFAEWMVWNALVIASIPSWLELRSSEDFIVWLLLGAGLLFASRIMYATLVYYTGAVPSEHFSVQKRPEYEEYQRQTNMFFPGPIKR